MRRVLLSVLNAEQFQHGDEVRVAATNTLAASQRSKVERISQHDVVILPAFAVQRRLHSLPLAHGEASACKLPYCLS